MTELERCKARLRKADQKYGAMAIIALEQGGNYIHARNLTDSYRSIADEFKSAQEAARHDFEQALLAWGEKS